MSTTAQVEANRENAQHSTGPKTDEGKAASSQNNHRHGLAGGIFQVLPCEDQDDYEGLLYSLLVQHQPQTTFEERLVQKMAQHFWLSQRALRMQERCFDPEKATADCPLLLALYLRYQITHERAYHKLSDELRKMRDERRKEQKDEAALLSEPKTQAIGFESQTARQAAEMRRAATEIRKNELHSKHLARLDAQIARLTAPAPLPFTPKSAKPAPNSTAESESLAA